MVEVNDRVRMKAEGVVIRIDDNKALVRWSTGKVSPIYKRNLIVLGRSAASPRVPVVRLGCQLD